jgi:hypothetical protein
LAAAVVPPPLAEPLFGEPPFVGPGDVDGMLVAFGAEVLPPVLGGDAPVDPPGAPFAAPPAEHALTTVAATTSSASRKAMNIDRRQHEDDTRMETSLAALTHQSLHCLDRSGKGPGRFFVLGSRRVAA